MVDIEKRVKELISERLDIDFKKIVPSASLIELGFDSLDSIEIIMSIEDEFDIEVPDEDTDRIKTVKDITDYVTAKV